MHALPTRGSGIWGPCNVLKVFWNCSWLVFFFSFFLFQGRYNTIMMEQNLIKRKQLCRHIYIYAIIPRPRNLLDHRLKSRREAPCNESVSGSQTKVVLRVSNAEEWCALKTWNYLEIVKPPIAVGLLCAVGDSYVWMVRRIKKNIFNLTFFCKRQRRDACSHEGEAKENEEKVARALALAFLARRLVVSNKF